MKKFYLLLIGIFLSSVSFSQDPILELAIDPLKDLPNYRDIALSQDGNEAYVTIQSPLEEIAVIVRIVKEKGAWSKPQLTSFTGRYRDIEPFLAMNDLRLYFSSNRALTDGEEAKDYDIWYVERTSLNSEWGPPINLGAPVNTLNNEFYPSLSKDLTIYFTSDAEIGLGKDDLYYAVWKDNSYAEIINMGDSINSSGYEFNAYISPTESFLLFTAYNRPDGYGSGDLYISFKNKDNTWTKAKNLGASINSKYMDYCPYYDPVDQTLYFTSRRSNFNSVNEFSSFEEFLSEIKKDENGTSKIFKLTFDPSKWE